MVVHVQNTWYLSRHTFMKLEYESNAADIYEDQKNVGVKREELYTFCKSQLNSKSVGAKKL